MTTSVFTATVAPDGTIHLPDGAARPGDTVVVHVERPAVERPAASDEDEYLTVLTADTPEKRERFLRQISEWGQRNRAEMSQSYLDEDWDALMYDENGLPK